MTIRGAADAVIDQLSMRPRTTPVTTLHLLDLICMLTPSRLAVSPASGPVVAVDQHTLKLTVSAVGHVLRGPEEVLPPGRKSHGRIRMAGSPSVRPDSAGFSDASYNSFQTTRTHAFGSLGRRLRASSKNGPISVIWCGWDPCTASRRRTAEGESPFRTAWSLAVLWGREDR